MNDKEIDVIAEEFPMGMKRDKWMEAYLYATKDPHSFMFYNIQKPKELRVMKNFDEILICKEKEQPSLDYKEHNKV